GVVAVAAGVELRALLAALVQPACVVHAHGLAGAGLRAVADGLVPVLQARGSGGVAHGKGSDQEAGRVPGDGESGRQRAPAPAVYLGVRAATQRVAKAWTSDRRLSRSCP